jgi:Fur family ferric uptake transcriptional regulator
MKRINNLFNGEAKHRHTAQRELLLDLIREADGHVDATELHGRARERQPHLSLPTVYRSLSLFKKLGLVDEHHFNDARRYYETKARSHHQHLVCLGCGEVYEFHCPSTGRLRTKVSKDSGFEVVDTEVRLTGYCPKCQRRLSTTESDTETKQQLAGRR